MQVFLFLRIGVFCLMCFTQAYSNDDDYNIDEKDGDERDIGMAPNSKESDFNSENEQYEAEKKAGDISDLFATNQHYSYGENYKDLGRRFVLQYPYKENVHLIGDEDPEIHFDKVVKDFQDEKLANRDLKPVKAPPELVLAVAKESAKLEASKPVNPTENLIKDNILRSGDYWNAVWKEDVNPNILRSQSENLVQKVRVKIMPGSKLYQLVSALNKISPRLIYVINKK